MKQLTGLDAAFLAMESDEVCGHVGSVCILDPSTASQPLTRDRLAAHLGARLHLVPVLHQRLLSVPLGLDQPYWVDEERTDLDDHVRQVELPAPGTDHQLAIEVARLHGTRMDRTRSLWEIYLITGLSGGRCAIYSKIHHAAIDGVGGDDVLAAVVDPTPEGRLLQPPAPSRADAVPGRVGLLLRSGWSMAKQPARAVRVVGGLARSGRGLALAAADRLPVLEELHHHERLPHPGLRAPGTPFNAAITAQRSWAFADLSLDQVKAIKNAAGVTINDVVMALCAGGLRRWLDAHAALPSDPLVAAVPVSIRNGHDASFGNQVSLMLASVPTQVDGAAERLAAATAAMHAAKADYGAVPPTLLSDASGFAVPMLAVPAWKLIARLRMMEFANPFNLFISNVPGPRTPLYYAGALILAYYPISAIAHGQGLNITVMSYRDRLCVGMLACRSLVPDLERLAGWVVDELDLLSEAVLSPDSVPPGSG